MDLVKKRLTFWRLLMLLGFGVIGSCTSKPDERLPDEKVMHFPLAMAQNGQYLAVSSSSADQKYHFGRMVVLDTSAIKRVIMNNEPHEPIAWGSVVTSNVLIPQETGQIYFSDNYVVTASRENNKLIAMPVNNGVSKCNDPHLKAEACQSASMLELFAYDPFAITNLNEGPAEENLLVSYLSSDRIDLVRIDKSKTKDALTLQKSFNAMDWLRGKIDADTIKNQRLITRKMAVSFKNDPSLSKTYFLLEQHRQKVTTASRPKASYLVAINTSDLLAASAVSESKVMLWNLAEQASIAGVHDFYIDEGKNEAYVLAHIPEALFKFDLNLKTIIEVAAVCSGATSFAVSPSDDQIVIPCFTDNRVASFSMASLSAKATSKVLGRGPAFVVIANGFIFCTLSNDGILAILDDKLNVVGHIFNKAPINRIGS